MNEGKIKLAIWGINDGIWSVIKSEIDPRLTDICFFIDNNSAMQKRGIAGKSVYAYDTNSRQLLETVDYVLIAAYSGYSQIKELLLKSGYPKNKIQLFVTPQINQYLLGNLDDLNDDVIPKIYFRPYTMQRALKNYRELYEKYSKVHVFTENTGRWYEKGPLIAHACGGYVEGRQIMYSNSKEALEASLSGQIKLIECDVLGMEQGEVVLAHAYTDFYNSIENEFTMLNISQALTEVKKYPNVNLLIDVKWDDEDEYAYYVKKIAEAISEIATGIEAENLRKQIVMEVYNEKTIQCAKEFGFDMFFTQYRNRDCEQHMENVLLCEKYDVGAVGFDIEYIRDKKRVISVFKEKGIKVFVFSTDSIEEYIQLKQMGVEGIFTNYLTNKDIL